MRSSSPDAPNFLILGAAKSGTTWLHHALDAHPDVYMPAQKETAFFCNDTLWAKGVEWYLSQHFRGARRHRARGEATPQYLPSPTAPARVAATLDPDALSLLVVLRDPVARARSLYWHCVRNTLETRPIEQALLADDPPVDPSGGIGLDYIRSGRYAEQLDRWWEVLPRERTHILLYDELRADPQGAFDTVCDAIGAARHPVDTERRNVSSQPRSRTLQRLLLRTPHLAGRLLGPVLPSAVKRPLIHGFARVQQTILSHNLQPFTAPPLDAALAARVRDRFRDDIERLQGQIGRDLSPWLRDTAHP